MFEKRAGYQVVRFVTCSSPSFFRRDMIQDMISVVDPKKAHNIYHVQCSFTK